MTEESRLNWEIVFGCLQEWNGSKMDMKGTDGSGAEEFAWPFKDSNKKSPRKANPWGFLIAGGYPMMG